MVGVRLNDIAEHYVAVTYVWFEQQSNRAIEQPQYMGAWVEKQNNNARESSGRGGFELIAVTTRL